MIECIKKIHTVFKKLFTLVVFYSLLVLFIYLMKIVIEHFLWSCHLCYSSKHDVPSPFLTWNLKCNEEDILWIRNYECGWCYKSGTKEWYNIFNGKSSPGPRFLEVFLNKMMLKLRIGEWTDVNRQSIKDGCFRQND